MDEQFPSPQQAQAAAEDALASLTYVWQVQREGADNTGLLHFETNPHLMSHALMALGIMILDRYKLLGGDPQELLRELGEEIAAAGETLT